MEMLPFVKNPFLQSSTFYTSHNSFLFLAVGLTSPVTVSYEFLKTVTGDEFQMEIAGWNGQEKNSKWYSYCWYTAMEAISHDHSAGQNNWLFIVSSDEQRRMQAKTRGITDWIELFSHEGFITNSELHLRGIDNQRHANVLAGSQEVIASQVYWFCRVNSEFSNYKNIKR